ncbi:MAG: helix-turn-helix transcriptional regulator [Erysipelotrichaceae bacterium]|nr:helix-turn-helix transcriptional regulator [Erysipelotrichaceae bacterium]
MKLTLAENIRSFRRQRKLTQEKLAEALGLTTGAVYKWESGMSQPELGMLVDIADFFDTSVDVLLGYRLKDNRMDPALQRISSLCQSLDPQALSEAEKLLGKYPHSFKAIYGCASVFMLFGASSHDVDLLFRSLELFEQAIVMLPQNDDVRISETTIASSISTIWFLLDEREKGLEMLKKNNAGGAFDSMIGSCLAIYLNRPEEAAPFLSDALINGLSDLLSTITGYFFLFRSRGDWQSAKDLISWGISLLEGIKTENTAGFIGKSHAELLALQAGALKNSGDPEGSQSSLKRAGEYARIFDADPDYSARAIRFIDRKDQTTIFDTLGASAYGSVAGLIEMLGDQQLAEQWKQECGHE